MKIKSKKGKTNTFYFCFQSLYSFHSFLYTVKKKSNNYLGIFRVIIYFTVCLYTIKK